MNPNHFMSMSQLFVLKFFITQRSHRDLFFGSSKRETRFAPSHTHFAGSLGAQIQ
jgi:hypothetical protein